MKEKIYSFFWWFAGARRDILIKHKNDHDKYLHIGLSVFLTSLIATITATYAANIAILGYEKAAQDEFNYFAILLGIVWGIFILNIDRSIIVTMQKKGNSIDKETIYEKWQNKKQEFFLAIPRILIALLIAKVILDPFEVMLYSEEISNLIAKEKRDNLIENTKEVATKIKEINKKNSSKSSELDRLLTQKKELEADIEKLKKDIVNKKKELENDLDRKQRDIDRCYKQRDEYKANEDKAYEWMIFELEGHKDPRENGDGKRYNEHKNDKEKAKRNKENQERICKALEEEKRKLEKENDKKFEAYENEKKSEIKAKKAELSNIEVNIKLLQGEQTKSLNKIKEGNKLYEQHILNSNISYNKALEIKDILFYGTGKVINKETNATGEIKRDTGNIRFRYQHYIFMAFIFLIELLPIITKLLSDRSSYDTEMQKISYFKTLENDIAVQEAQLKAKIHLKNLQENLKKNKNV